MCVLNNLDALRSIHFHASLGEFCGQIIACLDVLLYLPLFSFQLDNFLSNGSMQIHLFIDLFLQFVSLSFQQFQS